MTMWIRCVPCDSVYWGTHTHKCGPDEWHRLRYRAAMAAMSRFMVWVWCEAEAGERGGCDKAVRYYRPAVLGCALERGLLRLEWP
jgi:hypothetical protein